MRLIDADGLKKLTTERNEIWNAVTDSRGRGLTEIIDSLPAVDVVPVVHAHWKCNGAWSMAKQCSNCSFVYKGEADYMGNVHYQASNYCPNCGAKMDGGE